MSEDGVEETIEVPFFSETRRILHMVEYDDTYQGAIDNINENIGIYVSEKSGWMMDSIDEKYLHVAKYKPIQGSSWIPTPKALVKDMAIINVKMRMTSVLFGQF